MQTDEVLRTYSEYLEGVNDALHGLDSQAANYPLIDPSGRFAKKAYMIGYYDEKNREN